jgi:oxalate decarboxylase
MFDGYSWVQGTLEVGVFLEPGEFATGVMRAGDVGFAPQGSGHYLRNLGQEMAHVVLIFNSGEFTNVDVNNFLGVVPPSWVAASLDISTEEARAINYNLPGFAPAQRPAPGKARQQQSHPAAHQHVAQL